MVGIHVIDRRLFCIGKTDIGGMDGDEVGTGQFMSPAEPTVQGSLLDSKAEEGEIGEVGVELRLGLAVEIAALGMCLVDRAPLKLLRPAAQADAGMSERIALARLAEQQRAARIGQN